jgi:hypothetical protein
MSLELIAPNGESLDLRPGTKLNLNYFNSAFDNEVMKGSYVYSFGMPASEKNLLHFNFVNRMSSTSGYQTTLSGYRLKSGLIEVLCTLEIGSSTSDEISISLFTASGNFADSLRTTKLRDLDMGEVTIDVDTQTYGIKLDTLNTGILSTRIVRILSGGVYYYHGQESNGLNRERVLDELCKRINREERIYVPAWNNATAYIEYFSWVKHGGNIFLAESNNTNIEPDSVDDIGVWFWLGLEADLKNIRDLGNHSNWFYYDIEGDPHDYQVTPVGSNMYCSHEIDGVNYIGSTWIDVDLTTLLDPSIPSKIIRVLFYMYNKAAENHLDGDIKVFPVKDDTFLSDFSNFGYVNYWKDGGFWTEVIDGAPAVASVAFSPMLRMLYVLEAVHSLYQLEVDDEGFMSNDFIKSLVLYSNFAAEKISSASYTITIPESQILDLFLNVFKRNALTPDVSIAEFLNGIRSMFFTGVWFDIFQNKIKYKPLKDVLADFENAIDITELVASYNEINYSNPDGFYLRYTHDGSDNVASSQIKNFEEEDVVVIDPEATVSALPTDVEINRVSLVLDVNRYFISYRSESGGIAWKDWAGYLQPLKVGNGSTEIAIKSSTLMDFTGSNNSGSPSKYEKLIYSDSLNFSVGQYIIHEGETYRVIKYRLGGILPVIPITDMRYFAKETPSDWRVPYAGKQRKSTYYQKKDTCSLRLLSYCGIKSNPTLELQPNDYKYPFASCDPYGSLGDVFSGHAGGSLRWEGEKGLYNQFAKPWLDFLSTAKVATVSIVINASLLSKLKPWLLVKIENQYFMWSKIDVSFPLDSAMAKITLFRL